MITRATIKITAPIAAVTRIKRTKKKTATAMIINRNAATSAVINMATK